MAIESVGVIEPLKQYVDADGVPYAGGSLTFTQVGTSVAQSVYSDPALTVSLGNVITLNAAGRTSTSASGPDTAVYCQQLTYDYTLKNAAGTTIWGPITFSGSQWPGQVQGQAILSPAINANGYTNRFSTTINKAGSGTHALFAGTRFDTPTIGAGASTLTEAATVYIEGAPASGTNKYALHVASGAVRIDGTLSSSGGAFVGPSQFRLTLTSGTPITTGDVTAATTVFLTPYSGNMIELYSGSAWDMVFSTEVNIAVPATTTTMTDIFAYNNSGTVTLEAVAWTNDTTRATALTTQNGVLVKSGDATRRYVGSVRTTGVSGQTESSIAKRYLWNYYNRVRCIGRVVEATNTWTYSTATYRQANGAAGNQLDLVIGVAEVLVDASLQAFAFNDGGNSAYTSIGYDSTSVPTTGAIGQGGQFQSANQIMPMTTRLLHYPAVGHHVYVWLEKGAAGNTTWLGDNGDSTLTQSGIQGVWDA